jgi:thiol-disulfide isomerase/thioredoxin
MFFNLGMKIKNKIYEGFCYNSLKKNWKGKVLLVKQENFSPPPSDAPEFSSLPVQFYFTHPLPGTILTKYDKKNSRTYFSILSPSGDFGYAEGFFKNHAVKIFSFNGNGFFLIKGRKNQNTWRGVYISENGKKTFWESTDSVIKEKKSDKNFSLPQQTFLLPNGQTFSFLDDSLKGRPIVIHLLGTWCHNCRDESMALKEWVMKYYPKGIFFAALCVEKNNDTAYVRRRIEFVKERWNIHWPVIPAGISTAEPVASLFNLSENLAFPTTFFFDASHNPVSIHRTFSGPATGIHFTNWQKELESTLESLLKK